MQSIKRSTMVGVMLCLISTILFSTRTTTDAGGLSTSQRRVADRIAKVAIDNWDRYGVLPSVAVAQAFVESSLGKNTPGNNNLWGINSGATGYSSIESGTIGYMKVINLSYYKGAPFKRDREQQLAIILRGGYCQPVGNYMSDARTGWYRYGLYRYDKKLFKVLKQKEAKKKAEIARKKKIAKQKKIAAQKAARQKSLADSEFTVYYDESVPEYAIKISSKFVKRGTLFLYEEEDVLEGIYDVIIDDSVPDDRIFMGRESMTYKSVKLTSNEDVKG